MNYEKLTKKELIERLKTKITINISEVPKGMTKIHLTEGRIGFTSNNTIMGKNIIDKNDFKLIGKFSIEYLKELIDSAEDEDEDKLEIYITKRERILSPCFIGDFCLAPIGLSDEE